MQKLDRVETRLAVYGSLAPGEIHHRELAALSGGWQRATVRGRLAPRGWGERVGFPGMTWDPQAQPVSVQLFTSTQLPIHWHHLDSFEGSDYRRILVPLEVPDDVVVANIYEIKEESGGGPETTDAPWSTSHR